MNDKPQIPFSRREWLLVVCLLLMVEYWISSTSYEFSGNQSVLNYISFAGTIASILLAVIAIIFGFYQNDSQQKANGALSAQVDNLKTASAELGEARAKLETQLNRISGIANKLDEVDVGVKDIRGLMSGLGAAQKNVIDAVKKEGVVDVSRPAGTDSTANARLILRSTTFDADIFIHTLRRASEKYDEREPVSWNDLCGTYFAEALGASIESTENRLMRQVGYATAANQILATLRAFGFVRLGDQGLGGGYLLLPQLRKILPELDDEVANSANDTVKAGRALVDAKFEAIPKTV